MENEKIQNPKENVEHVLPSAARYHSCY